MKDEYVTPIVEILLIEDVLTASPLDEDETPGIDIPDDDWV